jgi:hypothetical protein
MSLSGVFVRYDLVSEVFDCLVSVVSLRDVAGCGVMFIERSCSLSSSMRLFGDFDVCLGFVLPILIDN